MGRNEIASADVVWVNYKIVSSTEIYNHSTRLYKKLFLPVTNSYYNLNIWKFNFWIDYFVENSSFNSAHFEYFSNVSKIATKI